MKPASTTSTAIAMLCCTCASLAQTGSIYAVTSSTTVAPNEPVIIDLYSSWTYPNYYALAGVDADIHVTGGTLEYVETLGLMQGFTVFYSTNTNVYNLVCGQLSGIIWVPLNTANPMDMVRLSWSSDVPGTYDITSITNQMKVYVGTVGASASIFPTELSLQITVIPASSTIVPYFLVGTLAARRRR